MRSMMCMAPPQSGQMRPTSMASLSEESGVEGVFSGFNPSLRSRARHDVILAAR